MSRLPTLLFVLPWEPSTPSGVNHAVRGLAQAVQRLGDYQPMILATTWGSVQPRFGNVDGIPLVEWQCRLPPGRSAGARRLLASLTYPHFRRALRAFLERHAVRAVNMHVPTEAAFSFADALASSRIAIPLLFSFHGADIRVLAAQPESARRDWGQLLSRSQGVTTCSRALGTQLHAAFPGSYAIEAIYNGIDPESFRAQAGGVGVPHGRYVLNVAGFQHHKGQDVLLDALKLIIGRHPDLRLVLAGGEAEFLPELRLRCQRLALDAHVDFVVGASRATVAALMMDAALFCLPSRREPFGIVLLEAACFGLPIVASRVDGIPEIVSDPGFGTLVEPDDPQALAAAIEAALADPAGSARKAQALRTRVADVFTWDAAARRLQAVIAGKPDFQVPTVSS